MSPEAVNAIAGLGTAQTAIPAEKPETGPSRKADGVQFQQALRNSLQPGAPAETETYTHTVKSGENLTLIVSRALKRQSADHSSADNINEAVSRIARHNNLRNPNLIYPGQRLDLSPLFSAKSAQSQGQPKNIPAGAALGPASTMAPASYPVTRAAVALAMSMGAVSPPPAALTVQTGDPSLEMLTRKLREVESALSKMLPLASMTASRVRRTGQPVEGNAPESQETASLKQALGNRAVTWSHLLSGNVTVTSDYGFRKDPFTGKRAFHSGVDLTSDSDAEIRAFATGTVVHSGWMPGYGKTVVLRHADGTETLYGHCDKINVSPGMVVARGGILGVMGSTGRSTGEHLHFEVRRNGRPVDPLKVLIGEQQYGQYYASRALHTVTGDLSGKTNSVRRAVKGYTTFPAALSVRAGRP